MSARFSVSYRCSCNLCLLVVLALFHVCFTNTNVDGDVLCMDSERRALLQFKHGLIDETNRLASWDDGVKSDCCRWAGITCDNITGHVHRIHLRGLGGQCHDLGIMSFEVVKKLKETSKQKLKGNISPSLLHLKQLEHLDLSCNDFGGIQVPKFIGSLGNLRYLNLSKSQFGGIIPTQLGNLSKLHFLCLGSFHEISYLTSTSMMNMQWLSSLRMLHHLDISGVDLSKATDWVQMINSLPSLIHLHLSNCKLTNIHPRFPSLNITSLSLLDLSFNNFTNFVPQWILGITSLVSLDLTRCNFHASLSSSTDSFSNLTSLKFLHVSANNFMNSSLVLKGLSSTIGSNLVSLDISSCGISSSVLNVLHNFTSLLSLDLSENHLTKTIPKTLEISLTYLLESFFQCKSPRLKSLSLISSNINGHVSDELGKLIHVEHLQLGSNRIVGTIPDSIGLLTSIRTLFLDGNLISGPIPPSIGQLSSLRVFDLSDNQLEGNLPYSIGRLSSLEVFNLFNNRVNGSLPDSLGQLSKLQDLDFSNNLLTGVVTEAHFSNLVSLKHLNGIGNSLTLRPQLANWIPPFQMQRLYLNSWVLGPQFPLWLQFQRDLIELDISNTRISSPVPELFWRSVPNLVYLDMSQNRIKGMLSSIPAKIEVLGLSFNKFRGKLLDPSNYSFPFIVDLSNNFFEGSLHPFLCPYDQGMIEILNLGNNHLSGVIPECWENWMGLEFLDLENNDFSGSIPTTLGSLDSLHSLKLHGNKLSGRVPDSLMNLTSLETLQLGRNEIVGSIPTWFGTMLSSLKILNMRFNQFDGNIPDELCYLKDIQILNLADNNLSGNIPRCFNNFSVLTGEKSISSDPFVFYSSPYMKFIRGSDSLVMRGREDTYKSILSLVTLLDLSNNNFEGNIPREITALQKLRTLNFSRNRLTGRIPRKIGDMKALETFDLSMNKLSGELPSSLSRLNFLDSFNVSYNNLTGRVPSSTQLQSFNESSFFGNKLCGDPLSERCAGEATDTEDQKEDDGSHGADSGFIISIVSGFIVGFWIVLAPLIISKSWRTVYFRFFSKFMYI